MVMKYTFNMIKHLVLSQGISLFKDFVKNDIENIDIGEEKNYIREFLDDFYYYLLDENNAIAMEITKKNGEIIELNSGDDFVFFVEDEIGLNKFLDIIKKERIGELEPTSHLWEKRKLFKKKI